ncbi:pathogenesis-related protein 5-like [Teratosphaeria destructans]|uniref:Pathogenesis-related protein 5-like n=1 Tax=Teratosphaeria destructans TaxID=418781 RepID=A0A9W7SKL1_9PEZI|nr:pathogenesis-related protein 5-like [Teratosphaeria destructans]
MSCRFFAVVASICLILPLRTLALHHLRQPQLLQPIPRQSNGGGGGLPMIITNQCEETIFPALSTQGGTGSNVKSTMSPNTNQSFSVSSDWQGRIWGRTNCTFNNNTESGGGSSCTTGDCGTEDCKSAGNPPATLAEFTMNGSSSQTFYDISLVDGYNLPVAIVLLPNGNSALEKLDQSTTNPSCVASVGDLAAQGFDPYGNGQIFLGTSSSDPLPFEQNNSASDVSSWCPWDLQVNPPQAPGNGTYPYPDTDVARPAFNPCYSACAKYNKPEYCCTGQYDGSSQCSPNYYSKAAKDVCPDAYSYAYDDQTSTFINPTGGGYQVIFCPGGRSTNIIASKGTDQIHHSGSSSGKIGWLKIDRIATWLVVAAPMVVMFFS